MNRLSLSLGCRLLFIFVVLIAVVHPEMSFAQDAFPGIPHSLEGRDACLACHQTGIAGAPKVPATHVGVTNDLCQACHQPISAGATATAAPPLTAEPTPEEFEAETGEPPLIPHSLEGRDACLACHQTGIAGAPKIPDDHAGRTNEMCQACHQPVTANAGATATAVPSPTAEPTREEPEAETGEPPLIPHSLEGRDACLACHQTGIAGAPKIPEDHAGRTNDMCQACHQPASPNEEETATTTPPPIAELMPEAGEPLPIPHALEGMEDCVQCHISPEATAAPAGGPPGIPHTLVGRADCVACHEKGVGGAPQFPADHAGRTSDVCQTCHQPMTTTAAPTPAAQVGPIPTPLVHPQAEGVDTCVACHTTLGGTQSEVTAKWQHSIHAKRGVSCADCHGGDPAGKTVDEAMSPDAGYIGVPDKAAIPALCASCHSDVALMRPYNLPTDQYAKYQESIHGIRLAEGDTNVTTCYDCHGGHEILETNDPGSTVYPTNVPKLCAGCHADEELMAPYHIPTDQFELYEQSVHGHALFENQDLRAPTCATCHGTHGAAPPGLEQVTDVCGSCHTATQEHFLQSPHAQLGDAGPKCVTCHSQHGVNTPSDAMLVGTEPMHCGSCHAAESRGGQVAQAMHDDIIAATDAYDQAEASVQAAADLGMLVSTEKNQLQDANTNILTARAVQHTVNTDQVRELTSEAQDTAEQVKASADAAVAESAFRRKAMIIVVAGIALVVGALYLLKRELHKQLEDES